MELFISDEARQNCFPLDSIVPLELELINKLEEDQLDSGRENYEFKYLSCFPKWLDEDETHLLDTYFNKTNQDKLNPEMDEQYEKPFIDFFIKQYSEGDLCVIFSKDDQNFCFRPKVASELLTYVTSGLREIQLYSLYDIKRKTYFIFLRDLTLLVATLKSSSFEIGDCPLHILK
ncbi:hypothetical protein KUL118_52530 [Tenacibaculum sp. KUL118]|nr:hypothetical protein KUL118_52530 [Tenacibaculum sp. KUL118]